MWKITTLIFNWPFKIRKIDWYRLLNVEYWFVFVFWDSKLNIFGFLNLGVKTFGVKKSMKNEKKCTFHHSWLVDLIIVNCFCHFLKQKCKKNIISFTFHDSKLNIIGVWSVVWTKHKTGRLSALGNCKLVLF